MNQAFRITKDHELTTIMGDFNTKVCKIPTENICNFCLGTRNERGEGLIKFCQKKQLCRIKHLISAPERRFYTWKLPCFGLQGKIVRNQIYYSSMFFVGAKIIK